MVSALYIPTNKNTILSVAIFHSVLNKSAIKWALYIYNNNHATSNNNH